ncbi:MAG: LysR family transcriptional regulator [Candidatus Binataceae bacterium]
MQWDDLRFFLAAARGGSLSAAAHELSVNYTTVSRRLAALQRRLGATLLQRTPDGLALTTAGEAVMALCERMEGTATELERRAAGKDRAPAGLVSVTATETFASRFIIPALASLRERHPEIEIELIPDYRRLDLSRRQADLAIRNLKPDDPRLVCRRIAGFGLSLYASSDYLARRRKPRRGEGLAHHELVAWTYILPARRSQFMGENIDGARISFRSNSTSALVRAVAEGFGIGFLPCYLADAEPGLIRLWPEVPSVMQPLWLIHHEDLRRVARIKIVADAIADAFRREARVLRGEAAVRRSR